jgi:hypothetical protein
MGQYHIVCNVDKGEFLHPWKFGQGLKFLEFATSGDGILYGLATLIADSMGRGSGDLRVGNAIIGSWVGDRVIITGDYGGKEHIPQEERRDYESFYDYAINCYEDISDKVIKAIRNADPHSRLQNVNFTEEGWRHVRSN